MSGYGKKANEANSNREEKSRARKQKTRIN